MRPAKTQISLGIRPVSSESSLSAWRKLGTLATHWARSEDSDQTGRIPRLIWVFAGRTCHFGWFCHESAQIRTECQFWYNTYNIMSRSTSKPTKWRAPSEDSDQHGLPPSPIRVFAVRMRKHWVLSYPQSAKRGLWSSWADARADLSLRWVHVILLVLSCAGSIRQ